MTDIKKILYPTDFSECSKAAFPYAYSLAKKFKAKIDVIHTIHDPIDKSKFEPYVPVDTIKLKEEAAASKRLKLFCDDHCCDNLSYEIHIAEGVPFKEIIKAAMELGSDIIVMGTHGYTGLDHLLIGSVAEKVVRESPIPVLTVKRRVAEWNKSIKL